MKFLPLVVLLVLIAGADIARSKVIISERILEGETARSDEAKRMVYLRAPGTISAMGGGSLIRPDWIITCGHCLVSPWFQVVVGTHNFRNTTNAQVRDIRAYRNTWIHPQYGLNKGPYDIGLIKLDEPFILNEYVATIELAPTYRMGVSTVFGFGLLTSGQTPDELQKLDTNIISYEECLPLLEKVGKLDKDSNICTYTGTIASSCAGDSGSPLVQWSDKLNAYWQVAVVSWGDAPCNETSNASALTKISNYLPWIHGIVKEFDFL